MNYQKIYNSIVSRGKNRILQEYTETHHIIPRCLGGTDDQSNLVKLTPEEHYTCHQLLVKIYPGNIKLVSAAMYMTCGINHRKSKNKNYGWLKRRFSEYMSSHNPNKNGVARRKYIEQHGIPKVDKSYITDEWRNKISKKMIGENNPIFGIKPWNHPKATEYTKNVWMMADKIRIIWEENNKPSYCKLYSLVNGKKSGKDWKAIGPYMNIVRYFRNGWVPTQDEEWCRSRDI